MSGHHYAAQRSLALLPNMKPTRVKNDMLEPSEDDGGRDLALARRVSIGVGTVAAIVLGCYVYWYWHEPITANGEEWGQFGDYMGGTINPVVGLATIFLILTTVKLQRQELRASLHELRASNKALAKQSFENSFFSWIEIYQRLLDGVRAFEIDSTRTEQGRHALEDKFFVNFSTDAIKKGRKIDIPYYARNPKRIIAPATSDFYRGWTSTCRLNIINAAKENFELLMLRQKYQFDGLFRTLYRLIRWVDEANERTLTDDEKWFYVSIIRAQLTWIEMVFLLFNCLTEDGKSFLVYANKYALFDNLDVSSDVVLALVKVECQRYGIRNTAFDSNLARKRH